MPKMTTTLAVVRFPSETVDEAIKDLKGKLSVEHEVVNERGGATGWPVVRFKGEEPAMRELLERYCFGRPKDLAHELARLAPVESA